MMKSSVSYACDDEAMYEKASVTPLSDLDDERAAASRCRRRTTSARRAAPGGCMMGPSIARDAEPVVEHAPRSS